MKGQRLKPDKLVVVRSAAASTTSAVAVSIKALPFDRYVACSVSLAPAFMQLSKVFMLISHQAARANSPPLSEIQYSCAWLDTGYTAYISESRNLSALVSFLLKF